MHVNQDNSPNAEEVKALEQKLMCVRVEAQEQVDRLLLQTRQVQENLELVFQDDQAKQKELAQLKQEITSIIDELEKQKHQRDGLAERVITLENELSAQAKDAAEAQRMRLHLHQMQEELEHQFLSNQQQKYMLNTYATQEVRFQNLLHKILQAPTSKN